MLKVEFRRRLIRLRNVIDLSLEYDRPYGNLFPYLASVYRYFWSNLDERVCKKD